MSNNVQIVLSVNKANFSAAMTDAQRQLDTLAGKARGAGHSTVSSMQASSAAIRLFEGGMQNNVRAVERFIATIPGVGAALKFAFPLVGAAALGGLVAKMGIEFAQFIQKVNQTPQAIQNAFRELTSGGLLANDELRKTNDELDNQIAKLSGKPQNNVAIALDDARIAADRLAQSLDQDNQKITQLLKDNQIGALGSLLTGKDTTTQMSGDVKYWNQELANKGHDFNQAVHQFGPDSAQAKAAQAALDQRRKDAETNMQMEIDYRGPNHAANVTGDQTANLSIAQGYLSTLQQQDDQENEQSDNKKLVAQQQALTHAKELAESQKQLQEQQVTTWQNNLQGLKAIRDLSTNDEANYWLKMASTVKDGSIAYQKAVTEANKLIAQQVKEGAQESDKWTASGLTPDQTFTNSQGMTQGGTWKQNNDLSKDSDYTESIQKQGQATAEWLKNLNAGSDIQRQNADAMAEASLQMAIATGQMSRLDAAQAQAQLHAQEYADTLQDLKDAMAAVANDPSLTAMEKNAKTSAFQNQISTLNGQRAIQVMQDSATIDQSTLGGSIHDALNQYVEQATDVGKQIADILTNAFQSVNQSLSTALVAHAYNGREYRRNIENALSGSVRGIGGQLVDTGMKNLEGSALKGFGFGPKADGSKANPYYVQIVNTLIAGGADSAGALPSILGGGSRAGSSFSTSPVGSLLGKWFPSLFGAGAAGLSSIAGGGLGSTAGLAAPTVDTAGWAASSMPSFQGAFASGGDMLANRPALVGERGAELFIPRTSGTMIPNNALGTTIHNHIDATGSTDPAGTEAAVHRAMSKYTGTMGDIAVAAVRNASMRKPSTSR